MPEVTIIGAGAYLTPVGASGPRPVQRGETLEVEQADADQLVADGVARLTSDPQPEPEPIEDQYTEMDLRQLRAAAAAQGIEGMERAPTKVVLARLREQESAGESETRIGSGDRR